MDMKTMTMEELQGVNGGLVGGRIIWEDVYERDGKHFWVMVVETADGDWVCQEVECG